MLFMKKNFKIFSKKADNGVIYTMGKGTLCKLEAADIRLCQRLLFSVGELTKSLPQQSSFHSDPVRPRGTGVAPRL